MTSEDILSQMHGMTKGDELPPEAVSFDPPAFNLITNHLEAAYKDRDALNVSRTSLEHYIQDLYQQLTQAETELASVKAVQLVNFDRISSLEKANANG